MDKYTKVSATTFSKEEVKVQTYSLPNIKRQIEMLDRQIASLQTRKADLEKLASEASKIGVVEKVDIIK
jgi:prefoldin subunit 5